MRLGTWMNCASVELKNCESRNLGKPKSESAHK